MILLLKKEEEDQWWVSGSVTRGVRQRGDPTAEGGGGGPVVGE